MYNFYDTSGLKHLIYKFIEQNIHNIADYIDDKIYVSNITLREIETSSIGVYKELIKLEEKGLIEVIFYFNDFKYMPIGGLGEIGDIAANHDGYKVLACAMLLDKQHPDEVIYHTGSLEMKIAANLYFGDDSVKYI